MMKKNEAIEIRKNVCTKVTQFPLPPKVKHIKSSLTRVCKKLKASFLYITEKNDDGDFTIHPLHR